MPDWTILAGYTSGLHGMTRNLALDLKPIRVNLVSPGPTATEMWNFMSEEDRQAHFEALAEKFPTGHVGRREFCLRFLI